jgi:hypothetical protein
MEIGIVSEKKIKMKEAGKPMSGLGNLTFWKHQSFVEGKITEYFFFVESVLSYDSI